MIRGTAPRAARKWFFPSPRRTSWRAGRPVGNDDAVNVAFWLTGAVAHGRATAPVATISGNRGGRPTNQRPSPTGTALTVALNLLACAAVGHAADADPAVVTVAPDGSGTHRTVQAAVDAAPAVHEANGRLHVITLRPGTYREKVIVPQTKGPIKLLGESAATTVLTFADHAHTPDAHGRPMGTGNSASVFVFANDFSAENVSFENTHGKGSQALAMHFGADRAVFRACRFLGYQDTLLLNRGRAYFERCEIVGAVDFIFGDAAAFFDRCVLRCVGPGYITAASTAPTRRWGFVFSRCRITTDEPDGNKRRWRMYLGRPWGAHGSVTFLHTEVLPGLLKPVGWHNWRNPANEATARFAEFGTVGDNTTAERAPWAKAMSAPEARALTVSHVLEGWDPHPALSPERLGAPPAAGGAREAWPRYADRSREGLRAP